MNTGHNWQFTIDSVHGQDSLGEAPWSATLDIGSRHRLRRVRDFSMLPPRQASLSRAVAASTCVPGLFEPIRLDGLYPKPFVLRLVDGGVQDNQGLASLVEENCEIILASDASGQTETEFDSGGGLIAPVFRSTSSMMERVREGQYVQIDLRHRLGFFKELTLIHLKKELDSTVIDYIGYDGPPAPAPRVVRPFTSYGIRREIQEKLARIRTDLDSFSEVEAFALMTSGYRMAETSLPSLSKLQGKPRRVDWPFLSIEHVMSRTPTTDRSYQRLVKLLSTGRNRFFRSYLQSPSLLVGATLATVLGLYAGGTALLPQLDLASIVVELQLSEALALLAALLALTVPWVRRYTERVGIALLGLVLWIPVWLHLLLIDRAFLRQGRVDRLR